MTAWRFAAILALSASAQEATVTGVVRDAQQHVVSGAKVTLTRNDSSGVFNAVTNANGTYVVAVPPGTYTVGAETLSGSGSIGPLALPLTKGATADLVIQAVATADLPFSDEPHFTVAGVKDNTYRGGHGSDGVLRSAEALARETVALNKAGVPSPNPRLKQAELDEQAGKAVEAARGYQRAAEADPSEPNLYAWGTELLTHRAPQAAAEVFGRGVRLFPQSMRTALALATALYSAGDYDKAATWFYKSIDRDPQELEPYLFLGKVQAREITGTPAYVSHMAQFVKFHPENPHAQYYYAVSLWGQDAAKATEARRLLERAVRNDPTFAPAYLQLGIIDATEHKYTDAIARYRKAIELSPDLEEAHYRLAAAYRLTGQFDKSTEEAVVYKKLSQQSTEAVERQRSAIQQFVIDLKSPKPPPQ